MYFVDRDKIEQTLSFLEKEIALFSKIDRNLKDSVHQAALERSVHMMIDAVLDVGNAIIDGFIMRDPGSYDDIIDILLDEKVISSGSAENFKSILPLRKNLVQNYLQINHKQVYEEMNAALPSFQQFPVHIRDYLKNELGPVSAFKK